jgi:hypothetical protein
MCAISASQPTNTSTTLTHLCTPIPGSQWLLVLDVEVPFIHPDRHALPRQPRFGLEITPLPTHEPIAIDPGLRRRGAAAWRAGFAGESPQ